MIELEFYGRNNNKLTKTGAKSIFIHKETRTMIAIDAQGKVKQIRPASGELNISGEELEDNYEKL